jgi:hypothetical protein
VALVNDPKGTRTLNAFLGYLRAIQSAVQDVQTSYRDLAKKVRTFVVDPHIRHLVLGSLRKEYHDRLIRNLTRPIQKAARVVVQCIIDLLFDKFTMGYKLPSEMCFHVAVRPFAALLPKFLCLVNIYRLQEEYTEVTYNEARDVCD